MPIEINQHSQIIQENETARAISKKLKGLGISGFEMKNPIIGPIITGFPIKLSNDTPLKKVIEKSEDLALACEVETVDIRRIGGEVVIFVPNKNRKIIDFKSALFWYLKDEEVRSMKLPILLGQNFQGHNSVIDLAEQPHILIAGSTGSGKSIFETNIVAALSMFKDENDLGFYLIDTKGLDLGLFSNLPHVRGNFAKNIIEWYKIINDLTSVVHRRNLVLQKAGMRNINEYNKAFPDKKLIHCILIVDELADLIEKDKIYRSENDRRDELTVMQSLQRIIQICRASGIHIIACTQRTSVDVINGVVKANFPTRISLKLPSSVDSRVILGQNGAENLLGKGDMLVKHSDNDNLERFHSPFVRLEDIEIILNQREMILQSLGE